MRAAVVVVLVAAVGGADAWAENVVPPKKILIGPETRVLQAVPVPNGTEIVTVTGDDRTLQVWDPATGKARTWEQGASDAGSVVLTPNRKTVLVGRRDGTVSTHDLATGRELARVEVGEKGKELARLFPLVSGYGGEPRFDLSPDGKMLALENSHGMTVTLLRWPGGDVAARFRNEPRKGEIYVSSVRFGAGGKTLYCLCGGDTRGFVAVWDVANQKLSRVLLHPEFAINLLSVSADGRWVAAGGVYNRTVTFWDTRSDFEQVSRRVPGGDCRAIAFSRDGKQMATLSTIFKMASPEMYTRPTVVVWELPSGRQARSWVMSDGHWEGGILFFSQDGQTLFTGGPSEGLQAWDLSTPGKK